MIASVLACAPFHRSASTDMFMRLDQFVFPFEMLYCTSLVAFTPHLKLCALPFCNIITTTVNIKIFFILCILFTECKISCSQTSLQYPKIVKSLHEDMNLWNKYERFYVQKKDISRNREIHFLIYPLIKRISDLLDYLFYRFDIFTYISIRKSIVAQVA